MHTQKYTHIHTGRYTGRYTPLEFTHIHIHSHTNVCTETHLYTVCRKTESKELHTIKTFLAMTGLAIGDINCFRLISYHQCNIP